MYKNLFLVSERCARLSLVAIANEERYFFILPYPFMGFYFLKWLTQVCWISDFIKAIKNFPLELFNKAMAF